MLQNPKSVLSLKKIKLPKIFLKIINVWGMLPHLNV